MSRTDFAAYRLLGAFAILLCLLLANDTPTAAQTDNWRFGVIESYEAPEDATTLGVGWTRVRFHWAETQADGPGRGFTPSCRHKDECILSVQNIFNYMFLIPLKGIKSKISL
jgi:hypothetical protein